MKYSNTTLRELNAQYRSVLKKCFLLNASLLIGAVLATPAVAAETPFLAENDQVLSGTYSGYVNDSNTSHAGVATVDYKTTGVSVADGTEFNGNVNNASTAGGALKLLNGVTIGNNVRFVGNKTVDPAWGGGAMYIKLANKAVESSDTSVTIGSNGLFDGNSGNLGGAIALEYGDVTIGEETTFSNNRAANGGAIAMWQDAGDRPNLQSSLTLNSVVFDANQATGMGGAIFADKNAGDLVVNNGTFTDNTAKFGGAIYNKGTLTFGDTSTFSNNSANLGGAIFNDTNAVIGDIAEGSFTNNKATAYKTADVDGGTDVYAQGGVIYNKGQIGNITADFIGNSATTQAETASKATANGGALALYQSTIESITGNFDGNIAKAEIVGDNHDYADDMISGSKLVSAGGGAIHIEGKWASGSTTSIGEITGNFTNNSAQGDAYANGGAIYMKAGPNTDVSIDQITGDFVNNSVVASTSDTDVKKDSTGGAISIKVDGGKMATLNIAGNFTGNSVSTNVTNALGGAIYNEGTLNVSDSAFMNNTALSTSGNALGGAIYNKADGIISLSGSNVFSDNTVNGVANDIYNLGTLNITGGTTTIDGGIDGTGALNVSSGATLDIGTAKVSQDSITFDAGSTLKANLLNTTSYGSLEANTIAGNGAALSLTFGSAGEYVIAKGTGADSFADATVADTNSLYDIVKTSSDADTLTYTASVKAAEDIANDAGVSTQTASVLSTLANASNDAASQIALNLQNELAAGNKDAVESAATDLAPTNTATVHSVATTVHTQILSAVNNRLATPTMGRSGGDLNAKFGPWVQGLYNKSKQDSSSATPGFRGYTQGVAFGLDTLINDVYTVGVGYAYNATDVKSGSRKTDVYGHNFFIYGEYQPNAWFVNGTVNYSTSDYKEQRAVTGVGIASKYDVDTWGGQVMTGYDMASGLTPKAGLRYLHIKQDSYTDTLGQNVKTDNTDLLTAVAGVNYAYDFVENDYTLTPEVRLAATYDIVSDNADATVVMGTGSYTTSGKRLPRFGVEAGVGVTMNMFDALDVSLNYDAGIRRDYTSHTGTVKFKYNF